MMWSCSLPKEEVKRRLVQDMFPSDVDGNPEDYEIDMCEEFVVLKRK